MREDTMLYKSPGPHEIHGGNFDYIIVDADEEGAIEKAISEGWSLTTGEARKAFDAAQAKLAAKGDETVTDPAPTKAKKPSAW